MTYDKTLDLKVAKVLNSNKLYYQMLQQWHDLRGGLAVEPDVKRLIETACRPGSRILEAGSGSGGSPIGLQPGAQWSNSLVSISHNSEYPWLVTKPPRMPNSKLET